MDPVIAISAHRDYTDRAGFLRGLDRLRANQYLYGGARGGDSDALQHLATTQPGARHTVVVPNRLQDQPAAAAAVTRRYATEVIELGNYGPDRYKIRNRYLVDHSRRLVAFSDGRTSGGTWNTIQYANTKGAQVSVVSLVGMNINTILAMDEAAFQTWLDNCEKAGIKLQSVKALAIARMKKSGRGTWQGTLGKIHRLK